MATSFCTIPMRIAAVDGPQQRLVKQQERKQRTTNQKLKTRDEVSPNQKKSWGACVPGHMTRSFLGARMMSAREPRLEESVMASVLFMARMEVSALLSLVCVRGRGGFDVARRVRKPKGSQASPVEIEPTNRSTHSIHNHPPLRPLARPAPRAPTHLAPYSASTRSWMLSQPLCS